MTSQMLTPSLGKQCNLEASTCQEELQKPATAWKHTVDIRCPRPWRFRLDVFAGPRAAVAVAGDGFLPDEDSTNRRQLSGAVTYLIDCTATGVGDSGSSSRRQRRHSSVDEGGDAAQQFPRAYADFHTLGVVLHQPRERWLTVAQVSTLSISFPDYGEVDRVTDVAVVEVSTDNSGNQQQSWTKFAPCMHPGGNSTTSREAEARGRLHTWCGAVTPSAVGAELYLRCALEKPERHPSQPKSPVSQSASQSMR